MLARQRLRISGIVSLGRGKVSGQGPRQQSMFQALAPSLAYGAIESSVRARRVGVNDLSRAGKVSDSNRPEGRPGGEVGGGLDRIIHKASAVLSEKSNEGLSS